MAVAFVVRDVEKRYGAATVLENATVTIHGDQKIGVIGRNGAGKSTLCRLLLASEEPEKGEILRADGLDLSTVLLVQDFLADFRGGVIVVSHDREFLKGTCDTTLLVERGGLTLYPGDVEAFFAWQAEQMDVARRTNEAIEAQRAHLQKF